MMMRVMDLSTPPMPGVPSCFAGDTPVELSKPVELSNNSVCIKDLNIGDVLKNGSKVTAFLKCAAKGQNIYKLNNVLVTGEHRVFHPILKWIKVKHHPKSVLQSQFNEPYVYCLGTDAKEFTIGDTLFSDWDDIDDEVLEDLEENCVDHGYLPEDFILEDIHTYLDSGFHASSAVVLDNGSSVSIKDIKVNDVLLSGDKVVAIVKIDGRDMPTYNYSFLHDGRIKTICGTKNIHINDDNLGVISGIKYIKTSPNQCLLTKSEEFMYHLLTDTTFFVVNDIRVHDYNSGIDKYLH